MGLFNKLDANVIKAAAVRSQQVLPNTKQVNARSIKESINAISDKVVQHFKDSKAVLIT
jgi:hypothetical protein